MNHRKGFTVRELLPGQVPGRLVAVRCKNPECGTNKKSGVKYGGAKLLGRFYPGTNGEIICSRCHFVNKFVVPVK